MPVNICYLTIWRRDTIYRSDRHKFTSWNVPFICEGWPGQWILARTIQGIPSQSTGHRNLRPGRGIVGCCSGRIRSQRRCQGPYLVGFMLHHHLTRTSHSSHHSHHLHHLHHLHVQKSRRYLKNIWRILKNIEDSNVRLSISEMLP